MSRDLARDVGSAVDVVYASIIDGDEHDESILNGPL